jgi:hypothetical protein
MYFRQLRIILLGTIFHGVNCQESFLLPFQNSGGTSSDEWAEFTGVVPHLSAFTDCHWEKLHYFNFKFHYVWNNCTIKSVSDKIDCIQFFYSQDVSTAGRGVDIIISFGSGNYKHIIIHTFAHRAWNNFCWTYENNTGENRIYLNGKLVGSISVQKESTGK